MSDLERNNLQKDQFGPGIRANVGRAGDGGSKGSGIYSGRQERFIGTDKRTEASEPEKSGNLEGTKQITTVSTPVGQHPRTQRIHVNDLQVDRIELILAKEDS